MDATGPQLRRLVDEARSADPDAWEAIYRRVYPRLFAYARRRLATDTAAEDAVSETMTRALHKIQSFVWGDVGLDGWLFGIARNVVLETYRSDARSHASDPATLAEPTAEGLRAHGWPVSPADPATRLMALVEHDLIRKAFARLSDHEQELLELRVVAGLASQDVASLTGRRPGAVRMAQSRALDRLRTEYEELSR